VKILGVSRLDDLAILSLPMGAYAMPLAENPAVGTRATILYRPGKVVGYEATEIIVKGYAKDGDSGGPIFNGDGLVGIIATYRFITGTDPLLGETLGPHATRIADFIRSLPESPPLPTPGIPGTPAPIPDKPVSDDLDEILVRISNLEKQIANLPQDGNCRDLAIKVQSLTGTVDRNKLEIDKNRQLIDALSDQLRDTNLGLQRTTGAVEVTQKEVIAQSKRIGELDKKSREATLRIQRLEQSTTALTTSMQQTQETLKGKMQFRLRFDQSGRVTGVEPR